MFYKYIHKNNISSHSTSWALVNSEVILPVLASAPLSGNKTKQITGRAFSSCCHFVVFSALFFCLLCSCTLRQKWNYAKTRERCPSCPSARGVRSMGWLAEGPHTWRVWQVMGMSQRWWSSGFECSAPVLEICAWGQISCRSSPALKQNIFYFLCDCAGNRKILLDLTVCPGEQPSVAGINLWNATWNLKRFRFK